MNPPLVPHSNSGKGKSKHSKEDTTESSISWQADLQHTKKVIDFLINNPADCRILFSSEGKKPTNPNIEGPPSGTDKNVIHAVIAGVIFSGDNVYADQYAANCIRFRDSVGNHITILWNKFCDYHNEFESTGAEIVPFNVGTAENLHVKVKKDFPWYDDLYKIWGSNPSFAAKTTSLKPGSDYMGDPFALTHPGGNTVCSPCNITSLPSVVMLVVEQPSYNLTTLLLHILHLHSLPPINLMSPFLTKVINQAALLVLTHSGITISLPKAPTTVHWNYGLPPQGGYAGGVTGSLPTLQFNFVPPQQNVPPSSTSGSP
ncbi:uncharacterized protein EDB93DRAFT_1107059 [Suillus bovinus]|uniref:uncharacterized protein n=1 Tax=Suillus bovinus TaxID=48563 RepID=UPI001B868410|nr:uncharacterized protein EDB93DRAFT_1107059 [Suillus bovinus]KAG2135702.1 hypothetical protein EDB93DRAFT_1107059 [Suillus bovinus]